MSNNKQLLTIKKLAKVLPNWGFNKNPVSLRKVSQMGNIFTAMSPKGKNVWMVFDLTKS